MGTNYHSCPLWGPVTIAVFPKQTYGLFGWPPRGVATWGPPALQELCPFLPSTSFYSCWVSGQPCGEAYPARLQPGPYPAQGGPQASGAQVGLAAAEALRWLWHLPAGEFSITSAW